MNIIGNCVKKDNIERMEKEKKEEEDNYFIRRDEENKKLILKYVDDKSKRI